MTFHCNRNHLSAVAILVGLVGTQCAQGADQKLASTTQRLTVRAECAGDAGADAAGTWSCGEERVVECRERAEADAVEVLHVDTDGCVTSNLTVNAGPYGVGTHDIAVNSTAPAAPPDAGTTTIALVVDGGAMDSGAPNAAGGAGGSMDSGSSATGGDSTGPSADAGGPVCTARLTIVDTKPPEIEAHDQELWPPNHKFHKVNVEDCVTATDACDSDIDVHFTSVAVDEADDATGSGHTSPDVQFDDCKTVSVRAERSGHGDGRIYALGWVATDHTGNSVEGVCHIVVPHDQGQGAAHKHLDEGGNGQAASQVAAPACAGGETPADAGGETPPDAGADMSSDQ